MRGARALGISVILLVGGGCERSPAPAVEPGPAPDAAALALGERVYAAHCLACHQADGLGVPHLYPGLPETRSVSGDDRARLIDAILHGVGAPSARTLEGSEDYPAAMAGFGFLTDAEVAALATLVRARWGSGGPVTPAEVAARR